MNVKIDVSENLKFTDKTSIMGVATDDGKYKKNVYLLPKVKKRINKYASNIEKIHSIQIYHLIKNEIKKYGSIHICSDISKNKLMNNLRKLFKGDSYWNILQSEKRIKISPVGISFVDVYVKNARKNKDMRDRELKLEKLKTYLKIFDKDNRDRKSVV